MNFVKTTFSIKDLENLSGIKAHTIRIWEKRYGLLHPERTDTNIRYYSLESLQKLLNVCYLNSNGYKISKIANLDKQAFEATVKEVIDAQVDKDDFIKNLKLAMINYDLQLFESTYQKAIKEYSFSKVFKEYFIPFLNEIGLLWQSGSINPTHEHFVSNLIKQKMLIEIQQLQLIEPTNTSKKFILFLPDNEIHDIGLNFLYYEILRKGYQVIMLGSSVPIDCLKPFVDKINDVIFASYFTVEPQPDKVNSYLEEFSAEVLKGSAAQLVVFGSQLAHIDENLKVKGVSTYKSIDDFISKI